MPSLKKVPEPVVASEFVHPAGKAKYGRFRSYIRALTFSVYFMSGIIV